MKPKQGALLLAERLFVALLRLLPEEFRERFSDEMRSLFRDQARDARREGRISYLRFCWTTARELLLTAIREHAEILSLDIDYALRMMRKHLGFTMVAIVVLGLAIGAATAAFSAANAILLRPLPFAEGKQLVQVKQLQPGVGVDDMPFSVKELADYRSRNRTLDSAVEYHNMMFSLLGGREPVRVDTAVVSANFFRVLGVTPLYGRTFMDEDDRPSAHPVLILSYEFWQRNFGGDRNVVGKTYSMNDKRHIIVGVLPPIPQFPRAVDVYMPTAACPTRSGQGFINDRTARMMSLFATLKPGVSLSRAEDDLRDIARQLKAEYPAAYPSAEGYDISITPVHETLSRDIRPVLIALAAAALLLLVLACANVSGLMLSHMLSRSKELTVRVALGASRARILRSLITEAILLALIGGLFGLGLAFCSVAVLVPFAARFTTLSSELHIGPEVVLFCLLVSGGCGIVVGLLPSIGLRQTPLFTAQMESINLTARMGSRTRGVLVAAQLAVSVVLLVSAGLTLRTLLHLENTDGGFHPTGVVTARIYVLKPSARKFYDDLLQRTRSLYQVNSVAIASTFPLSSRGEDRDYVVEVSGGSGPGASESGAASTRAVSENYFRTIGVPLISGRNFTEQDDEHHPLVVIINQQMAQHYWPNGGALGQTITFGPKEKATVVGIVGNVRQRGLDREPVDEAYCPFAQTRSQFMNLVLDSSRSAAELAPEVSWIVHDLDPDAVLTDVQSLSAVRENSLLPRRHTAWFFSVFATLALAITASGISGLMALEVTERKHEIGIRLALGATPGRVMNTMMTRVMAIVLGGLGCGILLAWLMSSSMQRLIYGIVPRDSVTFAVSSIVLVVIAASSSFLPLTRIARLDPTILLKVEG